MSNQTIWILMKWRKSPNTERRSRGCRDDANTCHKTTNVWFEGELGNGRRANALKSSEVTDWCCVPFAGYIMSNALRYRRSEMWSSWNHVWMCTMMNGERRNRILMHEWNYPQIWSPAERFGNHECERQTGNKFKPNWMQAQTRIPKMCSWSVQRGSRNGSEQDRIRYIGIIGVLSFDIP